MEENILICEDSLEGIFSAVYTAYEMHCIPERTILQTSAEGNLRLFAAYHTVASDGEKSAKVIRTLQKRFGEEGFLFFCHALAVPDERKATAVYRTIAKGLELSRPNAVFGMHADADVGLTEAFQKNAWNEIHHLYGFLRFRELEQKILFAEIKPKNDALPFLAAHFADRFPMEHFLIHDVLRDRFAVHKAGCMWFLADGGFLNKENLTESKTEQEYQELFRHFCHTIAIKERHNTCLQKGMLPLRFRPYMTEFQKEL